MNRFFFAKLPALSVVLSLLFLTAACAAGTPEKSEMMVDTPIYEYLIVRGDSSNGATLRQVVALKEAIGNRYGTVPASSTDLAVDTLQDEKTNSREILIGCTNRDESLDAQALLEGKMGYVIRSTPERFVITASSGKLLQSAVSIFVSTYLDSSDDGLLPADIDIVRTDSAAFYLVGSSALCLHVPEDTAPLLDAGIDCFASLVETTFGMHVDIESDKDLHSAVVLSGEGAAGKMTDSAAEELQNDQWRLRCQSDGIIAEAATDVLLVSALAALYEKLADSADLTLDGVPLFSFRKTAVYKGAWQQTVPRVIGGKYLTSESLTTGSTRTLYENVSQNAVNQYKVMLSRNNRFLPASTDGFLCSDGSMRLTLVYDENTGELQIVEQPAK